MKATPFEFRFRFFIFAAIYFLGFAAPWNYCLHLDSIRTWQLLAAWPARSGWISFSSATIVVLFLGIVCALAVTMLVFGQLHLLTLVFGALFIVVNMIVDLLVVASVNRLERWVVMQAPTGQRFCVVRIQRPGFPKNANRWE